MQKGQDIKAPRFSSFKPRQPVGTPEPVADGRQSKHESSDRRTHDSRSASSERILPHKSHYGNRSKQCDMHEKRGGKHKDSDYRPRQRVSPSHPWDSTALSPWDESPVTFFLDKKGDAGNVRYGALERSKVSAYYRVGEGGFWGCAVIPGSTMTRAQKTE